MKKASLIISFLILIVLLVAGGIFLQSKLSEQTKWVPAYSKEPWVCCGSLVRVERLDSDLERIEVREDYQTHSFFVDKKTELVDIESLEDLGKNVSAVCVETMTGTHNHKAKVVRRHTGQ